MKFSVATNSELTQPPHRVSMARKAIATYLLYMAGLGAAFLAQVVFARLFGAEAYGKFALAFTWHSACVLLGTAGFYHALLLFPSIYASSRQWAELRGVIHYGQSAVALCGSVIAGIGIGISYFVFESIDPELSSVLTVAFALVPLVALLRIRCSTIRAFGHVVTAVGLDVPLREAILLIAGTMLLQVSSGLVDPVWGMILVLPATLVGLVVTGHIIKHDCLANVPPVPAARLSSRWLAVALPMLAIEVTKFLMRRSDVFMIGLFLGTKSAGMYVVALYLADLVLMPLNAIGFMYGPTVAKLYSQKMTMELQRMTTMTARWSIVAGFLIAVPLIMLAEQLLSVFGGEFAEAMPALRVLAVGAFWATAIGSLEPLVMMTGNERVAAMVYALSGGVMIVLDVILIPILGLVGGAIASVVTLVVATLALAVHLHKTTGVVPGALGQMRF